VGSKALVRFLNRAACVDDDLEFASVISRAVRSGDLSPEVGDRIFRHIDAEEHPRLARIKVNNDARERVVGHLRQTLYAAHIKDLYEDCVEYLNNVSMSVGRKGVAPSAFGGEYRFQLSAATILECGSWDAALDAVTKGLGERLKALGTHKTVEFLDRRVGLGLDESIVECAFRYIDLRHLLVHEDGRADERFCKSHPGFIATPGRTIKLDAAIARDARRAITELVKHVDERAVRLGVLLPSDLQ